ncbi:hypothetical protein SESBI_32371 [Sesbania bispinosa]|nr:hypothetical protein SESBI_32371 [Sesbania bispinosa]
MYRGRARPRRLPERQTEVTLRRQHRDGRRRKRGRDVRFDGCHRSTEPARPRKRGTTVGGGEVQLLRAQLTVLLGGAAWGSGTTDCVNFASKIIE